VASSGNVILLRAKYSYLADEVIFSISSRLGSCYAKCALVLVIQIFSVILRLKFMTLVTESTFSAKCNTEHRIPLVVATATVAWESCGTRNCAF